MYAKIENIMYVFRYKYLFYISPTWIDLMLYSKLATKIQHMCKHATFQSQ